MKRQRLTSCYVKGADGNLKACGWQEALNVVAEKLNSTAGSDMAVVAGGLADAESLVAVKDLFNRYIHFCGRVGGGMVYFSKLELVH